MAALLGAALAACTQSTPTVKSARVAASSESGGSLMSLAAAAAARGDHSAAVPLYRAAHAQKSGDAAPLLGLGRSLMALGQYVEAERVFRKAVGTGGDAEALAGHGAVLLALGQTAAAALQFDAALERAPSLTEALRGRALSADLLGQHDDALAIYRRALDGGQSDTALRNNYGLSLTLHDDAEGGAAVLEALVRERAGGAGVRQNLALAYVFLGRIDQARDLLTVDTDPGRADHQMARYLTLKAMAPRDRMALMMSGGKAPPRDLAAPAVETFSDGPIKHDAALATVGVDTAPLAEAAPAPQPVPQPAAAPADQADADLSHIPLLEQNGWALQLAAYRKASQLVQGWELLRAANADLIGHLPPRRTEIDFGQRDGSPSGFYYRLNAGPLTDRAAAESLCAKLQARGAACWVRPPEKGEAALPQAITATP